MNSANSTPTQIIAIGGGKGGVGKSFVAANLATAIAQAGHPTLIVDLDLGGANLHTLFGVKTTDRGIGDFIYTPKSADLTDYATDTGIPRLQLISGNGFIPGIANLTYQQKVRILKAISKVRTDYVILDLGAGTSYNVIDFFSITESGIVVTMAEPTAILNGYEFLKNVLFRIFSVHFKNDPPILKVIENFKTHGGADSSVNSLMQEVKKIDDAAEDAVRRLCQNFRPGLILNMARGDTLGLERSLTDICRNFLGAEVAFLGAVPDDPIVQESLMRMRPVSLDFPDSVPTEALKAIARKCMTGRWLDRSHAEKLDDSGPDISSKADASPAPAMKIDGRRDSELSGLLAGFLTEYSAQAGGHAPALRPKTGEPPAPGVEAEPQAAAAAEALAPSEWLKLEPRIDPRVKLPRFASVPPPSNRFLFFRLSSRDAKIKEAVKIVESITDSENITLAMEQVGEQLPNAEEVGWAWMKTGLKLMGFNQLYLAGRAFQKAHACLGGHPVAANNRAASFIAAGRIKPAQDLLVQCLPRATEDRDVLFNMGLVYFIQNDFRQACDFFDKVRQLKDKATGPVFLNAFCLYQLVDYPQAQALFQDVVTQDVTDLASRFNIGLCQLRLGQFAEAIATFSAILFISPEDAEALVARGLAHWYSKNEKEAFDDLNLAIKKQPSNLAFRAMRGTMAHTAGRFDKAIEDMQVITDLLPANQRYQALIGEIRRKMRGNT
ncbi:MAG: P-loop NTPase [Lentisphaerae bacterium]|nr:P-loop NTPase [Lentisphaerota bacterium]